MIVIFNILLFYCLTVSKQRKHEYKAGNLKPPTKFLIGTKRSDTNTERGCIYPGYGKGSTTLNRAAEN
jgi:hypothetical protein